MNAVQIVGYDQAGYTDVPEPNPISNELLVKEDCHAQVRCTHFPVD